MKEATPRSIDAAEEAAVLCSVLKRPCGLDRRTREGSTAFYIDNRSAYKKQKKTGCGSLRRMANELCSTLEYADGRKKGFARSSLLSCSCWPNPAIRVTFSLHPGLQAHLATNTNRRINKNNNHQQQQPQQGARLNQTPAQNEATTPPVWQCPPPLKSE